MWPHIECRVVAQRFIIGVSSVISGNLRHAIAAVDRQKRLVFAQFESSGEYYRFNAGNGWMWSGYDSCACVTKKAGHLAAFSNLSVGT